MVLLTPDGVFRLHPEIRWAAFCKKPNMVEFSQMRTGIESYTSDATDKTFMEIGPLVMTSVAERLTPEGKAGKLECVIACFEKDYVLIAKVGNGHLAISVDRDHALVVFQKIIPRVLKLTA